MSPRRRRLSPELERQKKEFDDFVKELFEQRPISLNPDRPTEKERTEYINWLGQCLRRLDEFRDEHLTPEQLKTKYKRTPEVDSELLALDQQLESLFESMQQASVAGSHEEYLNLELEFWKVFLHKADVMEEQGSPADKEKAELIKGTGRSPIGKMGH